MALEKHANCDQEDCPVRDNGKCLEGLDIESCSHFYLSEPEEDLLNDYSIKNPNIKETFKLFDGNDLSIDEIKLITYAYKYNLIVIIGESDSGKTTLLASIFDLFQIGGFSNFAFSGSLTSVGFERRCHFSRESSKAELPDTEKTRSQDFNFLHLAIKKINELNKPSRHLLLSDISGERFRDATSSSSFMKDLEVLKYSDHIIFLLDGKRLADKFTRTLVLANSHQFIRRAIDVGIFDSNTEITIVTSKYDLVASIEDFKFDEIVKIPFETKFSSKLKKIEFLNIAARPNNQANGFSFGYGVESLLSSWITLKSHPFNENRENIFYDRYFDNYKFNE